MAITPSQSQCREIGGAAKYFRRLERRQGLTEADTKERCYAEWDGWSGWRPKGYTYDRPELPPSNPNDPDDSEDTEPEDIKAVKIDSRKRARQEDDGDIGYQSNGFNYVRRVKKRKVYHAQVAKPLIQRPPSSYLSPSDSSSLDETSSLDGNTSSSDNDNNNYNKAISEQKATTHGQYEGSTQCQTPPPSREGTSSPNNSPDREGAGHKSQADIITPASLRDWELGEEHTSYECLLGDKIHQIIHEEYEAAERQQQ